MSLVSPRLGVASAEDLIAHVLLEHPRSAVDCQYSVGPIKRGVPDAEGWWRGVGTEWSSPSELT
jgi:hypothetical protein